MKFWDQVCPKKLFWRQNLETEFKEPIVKFKICTLEYSYVSSFIQSKEILSAGTKSAQIGVLGMELIKKIVKFRINTFENSYVLSLMQNIWKFGDQICPKKVFWKRNSIKQLSDSESTPLKTHSFTSFI